MYVSACELSWVCIEVSRLLVSYSANTRIYYVTVLKTTPRPQCAEGMTVKGNECRGTAEGMGRSPPYEHVMLLSGDTHNKSSDASHVFHAAVAN